MSICCPSTTKHFSILIWKYKLLRVNSFDELFRPRTTDEVVKLKVIANFLFDFFTSLKNSPSYKYRNKLARSGAQFVPKGYQWLSKQMVIYLNVNIVRQEVYHLAD